MSGIVDDAFEAFRHQLLLPEEPDLVIRVVDILTAVLKQRLDTVDTLLIGSWSRGTACRWIYDVDVMVVLNFQRYKWLLPEDLLWEVRQAVSQGLPEAQKVRADGRAVTMGLYGTRVDVVPSYQLSEGDWIIPDARTHEWIRTNPIRHQVIVTEKNRQSAGMFTDVVKMLKVWNRNHNNRLRGFHLEMMAGTLLDPMPRTYSQALTQFFAGAPTTVIKGLWDPCVRDQRVDLYLKEWERVEAWKLLVKASHLAEQAYNAEASGRSFKAVEAWNTLLGSPFPQAERPSFSQYLAD